jgi:hypothetical protein
MLVFLEVHRSQGSKNEDGTKILHDRERFSHELTLLSVNGKTQVLTLQKEEAESRMRLRAEPDVSGRQRRPLPIRASRTAK